MSFFNDFKFEYDYCSVLRFKILKSSFSMSLFVFVGVTKIDKSLFLEVLTSLTLSFNFLLAIGEDCCCFDIRRRLFFEKPNIPAGFPPGLGLTSETVGSSPSDMLNGLLDNGDLDGDMVCLLLMLFLPLKFYKLSPGLALRSASKFYEELPLFMIAFRFAFSI